MNIETANRLLQHRKSSGLSQEELAEKIGVSRQAVSKWERAEASPDTDNLITLARVYGVSLDELLNVTTEEETTKEKESTVSESEEAPKGKDSISFKGGIHANAKNGDKVDISFKDGIHVNAADGTRVHIGSGEIHVDDPSRNTSYHSDTAPWINALLYVPYPVIVTAIFLFWGFSGMYGGWTTSWLSFLTVPLYYSLVDSIRKRDAQHFAFPVLTVLVYCTVGLFYGIWHPTWVIFILIPVYYFICSAINKALGKTPEVTADKTEFNTIE